MKKVLLVVLALMVVLSLTAITFAAPGKVTLRLAWWGNPTRDARTIKAVEMYMAKNPNVTIETETTGWAGYWDKMAAQAAANNLPDVWQMDYAYITQYALKDQLLDLTPYVKIKTINLAKVADTFISGGRVDDKLYGISLGTNAVCLMIDPAVLKKARVSVPSKNWTYKDLEKMSLAIYQKTGVKTDCFSTTDPRVWFENMLRQTGESFFERKEGASLGFTDTKLLTEFFDIQVRLLKAGALLKPDVAFVTTTPQEAPLAKGLTWNKLLWSNQVVSEQIAANRPIEIALFPKIANSKQPGTYLKPSMFFSISKSSANKEEAAKFVNWFVTDIEVNKMLLAERGIPIVPAVRDALKNMVDPVNKQVFDYISLVGNKNASSIDPADPVGAGEVLKVFRTIDQEVLYGTISSVDAAAKFMKQANEILAKNKTAK